MATKKETDDKGGAVEVSGAFMALMERFVIAQESIAADVRRYVERCEVVGVPGSMFERFNRSLGSVRSVSRAVGLWRWSRALLSSSEASVAFDLLVKVTAGLVVASTGKNTEDIARELLTSCDEKRAAAMDAKRSGK